VQAKSEARSVRDFYSREAVSDSKGLRSSVAIAQQNGSDF